MGTSCISSYLCVLLTNSVTGIFYKGAYWPGPLSDADINNNHKTRVESDQPDKFRTFHGKWGVIDPPPHPPENSRVKFFEDRQKFLTVHGVVVSFNP